MPRTPRKGVPRVPMLDLSYRVDSLHKSTLATSVRTSPRTYRPAFNRATPREVSPVAMLNGITGNSARGSGGGRDGASWGGEGRGGAGTQ